MVKMKDRLPTYWVDVHTVAKELGCGSGNYVVQPVLILCMCNTYRRVMTDLQKVVNIIIYQKSTCAHTPTDRLRRIGGS